MFSKKLSIFTFVTLLLLASAAGTAEKATPSKEKDFVFKVVERNSKAIALLGDNIYYSQGCSGHGVTYTHLAGKVLAEALRGQAERFDAFADLPHYPFPGGQLLRTPFAALGAWYYGLRDKFGM